MAQVDTTVAPLAQVSFIVPSGADPAILKSTLQTVVNALAAAGASNITSVSAIVQAAGTRTTITAS